MEYNIIQCSSLYVFYIIVMFSMPEMLWNGQKLTMIMLPTDISPSRTNFDPYQKARE